MTEFEGTITTVEALEAAVGTPTQLNVDKVGDSLDKHMRTIIAASPYLLLATSSLDGRLDVSPRGDPYGWVHVLDDRTILLPERPGNRRADTLHNLIENPRIGLIFLVPRFEETLRISGGASIVQNPALLEPLAVNGKVPQLGIVVHIEECFIQCARATKRAALWEPDQWPAVDSLPSLVEMIRDQANPSMTDELLKQRFAAAYSPDGLYAPTASADTTPS